MKHVFLSFLFLLLAMAFVSSAHALTVGQDSEDIFHFDGYSKLEDANNDGQSSANEEIWAIGSVSNIDWEDADGNNVQYSIDGVTEELTAYISGIVFPSDYVHPELVETGEQVVVNGILCDYSYYAADVVVFDVTNATMDIYYDTTTNYTYSQDEGVLGGTAQLSAVDSDTDDVWLSLDFVYYVGYFTQMNIYTDAVTGEVVLVDGGVGSMEGYLDVTVNNTGIDWIGDEYGTMVDADGDGTPETWVSGDFVVAADLVPISWKAETGWTYSMNDPLTGSAAVPEPGTMTLIGFGLLGMAGLLRRKNN